MKKNMNGIKWLISGFVIAFIFIVLYQINDESSPSKVTIADTQQWQIDTLKSQVASLKSQATVPEERNTAYIIAEWQNRMAQVTCQWKDNGGNLSLAQGSATLSNQSDVNTGTMMTALTNAHVIFKDVDTPVWPEWCLVGIYGRGSRMINYTKGAFLMGTLEDYGYINLEKASKVDETAWEDTMNDPMKYCTGSKVVMGDNVVILGYPGIGSQTSVTATEGIVSAVDGDYYLTSAKIDHGSSGGAAILVKDDCWLGIPTGSVTGDIESMGRILKWSFPIKE